MKLTQEREKNRRQFHSSVRYVQFLHTSRTVLGAVHALGVAIPSNGVTVAGLTAYRKGEYFRREVPVNNTSAAVWTNLLVSTAGQNPVSGNMFVPQTPEAFVHDFDGNLTTDGRFNYTWDAENRLLKVESLATSPTASKRRVTWEFDGKGRRIRHTTYDGSSGSYVATEDLKFVSDGWRHIAELNAANNNLVRSYLWGLDLSGTFDGAGGVGGLLLINSAANGAHFTCYDGNGNVSALLSAQSATVTARYEYGPFGEPLRVTGSMAKENPFRFSTKRANDTTDLLLYEYRVYSATTARWLARDPLYGRIPELQPYAFSINNPISAYDFLGLIHQGQVITVKDGNVVIGSVRIAVYAKTPFDGKFSTSDMVGAMLIVQPDLSCCGVCYKWRQYQSTKDDDRFRAAPDREGKWRYLPSEVKEFKDVLDIDYGKPFEEEWYPPSKDANPAACSYLFKDFPALYPPWRMFYPSSDEKINKVTVSFQLQLVKVQCGAKRGGDVLLTIDWGYWFTKDENGLLNQTTK